MPNAKQLIHFGKFVGAFDGGYLYEYQERLYAYTKGKVVPHEEYLRQRMA
jgi:hypothetical protein